MSNDLEKAEKDLEKAERDLEKAVGEVDKAKREIEEAKKKEEILVSVSTTAGFYPTEGFNSVPEKQQVHHELQEAKKALGIKDVAGWIATVTGPAGKRTIDPAKSYMENGLSGKAEIDWGPSEGGGG
jgi:multidrug resistance efflux pump